MAAGANNNIYIGYNAGLLTTTGAYNVYLGAYAGHETRAGYQNTFVGGQAGYQVTSGINNSYFGFYAGANSTTGSYNTMIGSYTGFGGATTGSNNTFCGHYSGYPNTSGANNTYIGFYAGSTTTTGSSNVYIGSSAVGSAAANTNEIIIGSNVTGAGSNTIKLGNSSSTTIYIPPSIQPISGTLLLNGNVGIGTASPYSQLSLHAAYTASGLFPTSSITWSTTNGTPWQLGSITGYVAAGSGGSTGNLPGGLAFATKAADNSYSSSLTTQMVLDAGGSLGIGTTTPICQLHIYGANTPAITLGNSINSSAIQLGIALTAGNYSSWAVAGDAVIRATGTSNLILQCGDGTGAIYIKNNNNVGIGTTNPGTSLHISNTGGENIIMERTSAGTLYGCGWTARINGTSFCKQLGGWASSTNNGYFAFDPANAGSFGSDSTPTNALLYGDWSSGVISRSNIRVKGEMYVENWLRITNNDTGIYWENLGRGITSTNSSTYGNVSTYGTGKNNWSGYDIYGRYTFMANSSTVGIHDNNNSWLWRNENGTTHYDRAGHIFNALPAQTNYPRQVLIGSNGNVLQWGQLQSFAFRCGGAGFGWGPGCWMNIASGQANSIAGVASSFMVKQANNSAITVSGTWSGYLGNSLMGINLYLYNYYTGVYYYFGTYYQYQNIGGNHACGGVHSWYAEGIPAGSYLLHITGANGVNTDFNDYCSFSIIIHP